jgi:GH25 family lysozyme M1 (1,4-beta-N-acetylmuramidase)
MNIKPTKGIDISTWQDNVNFEKVKKAGYDFVIIRAGFGSKATQKDNRFEQHYKGARAAGMAIGAYHYSYAKTVADAKNEAKVFLEWIKGKAFELPLYFDMEEAEVAKLGKKTCTSIAKAFCEEIKAAGYKPGVYSNLNWFTSYLDYDELKKSYSIWFAQYYKEHQLDCDIWQNSSTGKVDGYNGNIDTNYCYIDFEMPAVETKPSTSAFKKGDKVKVQKAITYDGKSFRTFFTKYNVIEVNGDRVVIGIGNIVTAAVNAENLALATSTKIKKGSIVRVEKGAKAYDGSGLADFVYNRDHVVTEIVGDRAVITYEGIIVAAMKISDLIYIRG